MANDIVAAKVVYFTMDALENVCQHHISAVKLVAF